MKYIKIYEVFMKEYYLLSISFDNLGKMCKMLKDNNIEFWVYENGQKIDKYKYITKQDFLIIVSIGPFTFNTLPVLKYMKKIIIHDKKKIGKYVGRKLKDEEIDLYINAKQYNL